MAQTTPSIGQQILALWQRLSPWPGGRYLFGLILNKAVPYTGTIKPAVCELRPGFARIEMADRRRVRNHLNSVHAIALLNLGEAATGLALLTGMPPGVRGIITGLSMEYFKKARGRLSAGCTATLPSVKGDVEHEVIAEITDKAGDVVARCTAKWRLGLIP